MLTDKHIHCAVCSIPFKSSQELKEHEWSFPHHQKMEAQKKGVQHSCDLCRVTPNTLFQYRDHIDGKKHTKAVAKWKSEGFQSLSCDRRNNQREYLNRDYNRYGEPSGYFGNHPAVKNSYNLTRPVNLQTPRNPVPETVAYTGDGSLDCNDKRWMPTKFRPSQFPPNFAANVKGFCRNMHVPSLLGSWCPPTSSFMKTHPMVVKSRRNPGIHTFGNTSEEGTPDIAGLPKEDGTEDADKVDINDFRSSIAKKADLSTPCSTDNVDAKTKSSLNFSVKASQIIDDVLMGRPPKPKTLFKKDSKLSKSYDNVKGSKKLKSSKSAQILQRAKEVCEQSRLKRQLASQMRNGKDCNAKIEGSEKNKEVEPLTERGMANTGRSINIKSKREATILRGHNSDNCANEKLHNSSLENTPICAPTGDKYTCSSKSRMENLSLRIPNANAHADTSGKISEKDSPKTKGRGKIGKDNLKKLVTAPRSRKEQMLLAKMMQNYTKAKPSSRPKLTTGLDSQSDLEFPIYVEDLPDDVQMQIAQLLEEEGEADVGDSDPEVMNISELETNKHCSVNDSGDDLEIMMIQEEESVRTIDSRYHQDDDDSMKVTESKDQGPEEIFVDGSTISNNDPADTSTNSCQYKRRKHPDFMSEDILGSHGTVQQEKKPRFDANTGVLTLSDQPDSHSGNEREELQSSQQRECSGTVEKLLNISLQEEHVRNKIMQTDKAIQELQILLMQTQQQLQAKMVFREQLCSEEVKLRKERMTILRGAVTRSDSPSISEESSQLSHTSQPVVKQESVALDNKVVISEPDTTTTIGTSPVPVTEQISRRSTLSSSFNTNREMSQDDDQTAGQKYRSYRTLSQSSADMSGDSEYTAQYVGTVKLDTGDNVLEELAANLTGLQQTSYMVVKERDIENSDEITKLDGVLKDEDVSSFESISNETFKNSRQESERLYVDDMSEDERRTKASRIGVPEQKQKKSVASGETITADCSVQLARLDPNIVKNLTGGNPTIVIKDEDVWSIEEEDTTELSIKEDLPEAFYSPGSKKKRKTKKERDSSRNKVQHSLSESENEPLIELYAENNCSKRKRKKSINNPEAKILQNYLHAPSSSDIELENPAEKSGSNGKSSFVPASDQLVINPGQMRALRESAQRISFGKKKSTSRQSAKKYQGHTQAIHCMQVYNGHLFTGSEDHTAMKFNVETCEIEATYKGHTKGVRCLCISEQPRARAKLITGSFDATIIAYNIENDEQEDQLSFPANVLCFCDSGRKLYVGLADGTVSVVNISTMKEVDKIHGSQQSVCCIRTGKEGVRDLLLVASLDGIISVRDIRSGLFIRSIMGHTRIPRDMQVVNHLLFSAGADNTVQIHDITTGDLVESLSHKGVVTSLCVDDNHIYTAGYESVVRCYNKQTYKMEKLFYGADKGVITSMLIHENELLTGANNGMIESIHIPAHDVKWTCKFGKCERTFGLKGHLEHHVVRDHIISSQAVLKCLWTNCDSHLYVHNKKQETIQHILDHLNE